MSSFNRVTMKADSHGEVMIYDTIGKDWWTGEGITGKTFDAALKALGPVSLLDVRINSGGGDCFEGSAIYSMLVKHPAKKMVYIDGIAASMATIIAMAGDEIHMAENALFMIHEPSAMAVGTADEMLKTASLLEALASNAVNVYADRSGGSKETIKQQMRDETWFTAAQAVDAGFVEHITPNKQLTAQFEMSQFTKAPDWARERLAQFQQTIPPKGSALMSQTPAAPPAAPATQTENTPPAAPQLNADDIKAQALAGERERTSKIMAACNLAKRPDMATQFLEDPNMTVEAVQAQLLTAVCQANKPAGDEGGPEGEGQPDPDQKYKQAYKASAEHQAMMSESDFIKLQKARESGSAIGMKV